MKKPEVYRLFAAKVTEETAAEAAGNRFHRLTPGYILLYTSKAPGKAWVEVQGKDLQRLTKADETWLWDCGLALTAEVMQRRKGEAVKNLGEMVDQLERELQAEQEKGSEVSEA